MKTMDSIQVSKGVHTLGVRQLAVGKNFDFNIYIICPDCFVFSSFPDDFTPIIGFVFLFYLSNTGFLCLLLLHMNHVMKTCLRGPTRPNTNRAVQPQMIARRLKFRI